MREHFYQLVLQEIRCQPGLQREIEAIRLSAESGSVAQRLLRLVPGGLVGDLFREALDAVWKQGRAEARRTRTQVDLDAEKSGDAYASMCRSALVYLFFGDAEAAEYAVNLAKQQHDEWGFAHHVYGLVRCMQGQWPEARFELHLAREREPEELVRQRIGQALALVEQEAYWSAPAKA